MAAHFFIIGAQKAGTTSLWRYLLEHPQVSMPAEKEAPYFASGRLMSQTWDDFERVHFRPTGETTVIGSATPQYMCHCGVAGRIRETLPAAKLIALLRSPAERAVSHYKMARRWGHEARSFARAIEEQLRPESLHRARAMDYDSMGESDHTSAYVCWGEYGRILREFTARFPGDQLLCILHEDLLLDRITTYRRILRFLGVDEHFVPHSITRQYHRGGVRVRSQILAWALRHRYVKAAARLALTREKRRAARFRLTAWNAKEGSVVIPSPTYHALTRHYEQDVRFVEALVGHPVAWRTSMGGSVDI